MKKIITISMEMKENEEKVELKFQSEINPIGGVITEEVANKIREKIADIAKVVSDAIEKDMNKKEEKEEELSDMEGLLKFLNEMANIEQKKKETYEKATDEEKKKIDEFEKGLDKLETIEEKLDYTIDAILKEILNR